MHLFLIILTCLLLILYFKRDAIRAWLMRRAVKRMHKMMGVPDPEEERRRQEKEEEQRNRRRDSLRRNATHIHRHVHVTMMMMKAVAVDAEFIELTVCRVILPPENFTPEDQITDAQVFK